MKRYIRAFIIFFCGIIAMLILSFIIPQFHLAQMDKNTALAFLLVAGLSLSLITTSFLLKEHLNLGLFISSYMLSSIAGIGLVYYQVSSSGQEIELFPLILLISSVGAANVVCELYIRKKLHLMAEGCLSGRRLEDYTRRPWMYLDEKSKKTIFVLYFDVPELLRWTLSKHSSEIREAEDNILELVTKKIGEHDGMMIRKSEDSFIALFELPERLDTKSFKTTERYSAYHAVLCAIELKSIIDAIKNLKGRAVIVKDTGTIIKHIRSGRIEFSLFSDAVNKIAEILQQSSGEDILCSLPVYELCSGYFRAKKHVKGEYQILGLSTHIDDGL